MAHEFKRPLSPSAARKLGRPSKVKVLDEDEYVQQVSDIIQRDFFPELEKVRAQADYIDAVDRKDTDAMRRLRERFSTGRAQAELISAAARRRDGGGGNSPDTFETPLEVDRQREDLDGPEKEASTDTKSQAGEANQTEGPSLDEFMRSHTSEDNASFNEIMEESRQKFRLTHAWMFKDEQKSLEMKSEQLRLPSIEQQAGGESKEDQGRSKPVDGFTYRNVNAVFYTPDNVPLTPDEVVERAKKDRSIAFENTRFSSNPWRLELQNSTLKQTALYKREKEAGKVGVDGKETSAPSSSKGLRGFNYVSMTPSPRPGVDDGESPFMTWGEVESTPYRLEGCDTPLPISAAGAPGYSIQAVPRRDQLAYDLAEKNSKFYRDRKEKAIAKARSNIRTPSGMTERVAQMSPAAQRLATSKLGIRLGTDKALKAAYTPSRLRSSRQTPTPTPTSSKTPLTAQRSTAPATPKLQEAQFSSSLTDNLLDLSNATSTSGLALQQRRDRMTASDFL